MQVKYITDWSTASSRTMTEVSNYIIMRLPTRHLGNCNILNCLNNEYLTR